MRVGAWARYPLKILAALKFLRGTALDPFAYTQERQAEHRDVRIYLSDIDLITETTTDATQDSAKGLANAPSHLKGYGHIRSNNRETWLEHRNRYRTELQLVQPLHLTDVNNKGTHE
jgi:indolepyruvate ferredoxin oxidoreductase